MSGRLAIGRGHRPFYSGAGKSIFRRSNPRESLHEFVPSAHGPVTIAGRHGPCHVPGSPRAVVARRTSAVLCADRATGAAGGGQRLRHQGGAEPQSADGRSDFSPLLRGSRQPARADAALARIGRDGRSVRPGRHQRPRHRGRRPGQGVAVGQARIRGRDRAEGSAQRSRGAQAEGHAREIPDARFRQFRRTDGRRRRARDRQSLRRRPDRDPRHHFGAGAHTGRHHRLPVLHPDRRGDQSRQLRRRAGRHERQACRHQHRDLLALRRFAGHRLCDSRQHGARRGRLGQEWRQGRQAAVARRAFAGGDAGDRRDDGAEASRRRAGVQRRGRQPCREGRTESVRSDRRNRRAVDR